MSATEEQWEQISPIQHQMMLDSLKPEEQHQLKILRENANVDQEKSIKLILIETRKLFDEVATDPLLRTTGVMAALKTEAAARIRYEIFRNPAFAQAIKTPETVETVKMENWANRKA